MTYRLLAFLLLVAAPCLAQDWDVLGQAATEISKATDKKLTLSFEQRGRYEYRTGTTFGRDPDIATGLLRVLPPGALHDHFVVAKAAAEGAAPADIDRNSPIIRP